MPLCLECGQTLPRLQWTHFKFNCTGKFANSKEYKAAYPTASLVDPEISAKTSLTLNNFIVKYGEVIGKEKWDSYREKQAISNSLEYKAEKYGWTKEEFDEFNRSRATTFESFVSKYGEEEASVKWDSYCERQRFTNSLDYFIDKYGENGLIRWNECNKAKGNFANIYFIMERYNIDFAGAEQILSNRNPIKYISSAEMRFVDALVEQVGDIKYTYKTNQFCIWSTMLKSPLFYDVTCTSRNKIIEFNGDYWHCNPANAESDFVVQQTGLTAAEIWERDKIKRSEAESRGFDVKVIWDSDFNQNKQEILKEIVKWWNT